MKYALNLVRTLRREEHRRAVARRRTALLITICLTLLTLSLGYRAYTILTMLNDIADEKHKLAAIDAEYRQYKTTTMIVDKADIELLDQLQTNRIFWTKKLASMAVHLPENYWVTTFEYPKTQVFKVKGYGYIAKDQQQLITIDEYLNLLRTDSLFSDVLRTVALNQASRDDEGARERVSFEFSAFKKGVKR